VDKTENRTNRRSFLKLTVALVTTSVASLLGLGACVDKPAPSIESPIPPESEVMKQLVNELNILMPQSNPHLQYLRGGDYDEDKDRRKIDSYFVVFDTGDSIEDANQTLKFLARSFTYARKTNTEAGMSDSVMITEQLRRFQDSDFDMSTNMIMDIPPRDKKEYVRLAIKGKFSKNDKNSDLYLLRIWPEGQIKNLDKFLYMNITTGLSKISDGPEEIATIDASVRMLK